MNEGTTLTDVEKEIADACEAAGFPRHWFREGDRLPVPVDTESQLNANTPLACEDPRPFGLGTTFCGALAERYYARLNVTNAPERVWIRCAEHRPHSSPMKEATTKFGPPISWSTTPFNEPNTQSKTS